MKHKIAISVDADVMRWVDSGVEKDRFRNRSHGFEYCVKIVRGREIA